MDLVKSLVRVASDPRQTRWLCPLLLVVDVVLCGLIIWKVPCERSCFHLFLGQTSVSNESTDQPADTEIDWRAYMEQVALYTKGERDYTKIRGGTGPLVYPAAHVYIYRILYGLTDGGVNIRLAQYVFGILYLATLSVVMACYRQAKVSLMVPHRLIL